MQLKANQLEGRVFCVMASTDEPLAVTDVVEALQAHGVWGYTTVKTVLDRLTGKRVLTRTKCPDVAKRMLYRMVIDPRRPMLADLVNFWFEGDAAQVRELLDSLTPDELEQALPPYRKRWNYKPRPREEDWPGYQPVGRTPEQRAQDRELIG